jgi:hypothetical protein
MTRVGEQLDAECLSTTLMALARTDFTPRSGLRPASTVADQGAAPTRTSQKKPRPLAFGLVSAANIPSRTARRTWTVAMHVGLVGRKDARPGHPILRPSDVCIASLTIDGPWLARSSQLRHCSQHQMHYPEPDYRPSRPATNVQNQAVRPAAGAERNPL